MGIGGIGLWDNCALRACGDWDKWAFGGKGILGQRGVLGPMSIGTNVHLGKRAVWSKWANGGERFGDVCQGVGAGEKKCEWRCVRVVWGSVLKCGVGEERSGGRCKGGFGGVKKYGRK